MSGSTSSCAARTVKTHEESIAVMGSSDSDGFIPVSIEDDDHAGSKSHDNEIKVLERKLAFMRAISLNKEGESILIYRFNGTSTSDSSKDIAGSVGRHLRK
eukprot:3110131-Amphidinium_carterae.1